MSLWDIWPFERFGQLQWFKELNVLTPLIFTNNFCVLVNFFHKYETTTETFHFVKHQKQTEKLIRQFAFVRKKYPIIEAINDWWNPIQRQLQFEFTTKRYPNKRIAWILDSSSSNNNNNNTITQQQQQQKEQQQLDRSVEWNRG